MHWLASAGIPGVPGWVSNTISIGGLVMLIITGLITSRLWTKSQVDRLITTHDQALQAEKDNHKLALNSTIEFWKGARDDAVRREGEWREVALKWQSVVETLSDGLEPLHEQGVTMLTIVQEMQRTQRGRGVSR